MREADDEEEVGVEVGVIEGAGNDAGGLVSAEENYVGGAGFDE